MVTLVKDEKRTKQPPERFDRRRQLVTGDTVRRAQCWPDIQSEGGSEFLQVAVETRPAHDRMNEAYLAITIKNSGEEEETRIGVMAADLPQIAACLIRATMWALRDNVIRPIDAEGLDLIQKLDAVLPKEG